MIEVKEVFLNGVLKYLVIVEDVESTPIDKKVYAIMEAKQQAKLHGIKTLMYLDVNNIVEEIPV